MRTITVIASLALVLIPIGPLAAQEEQQAEQQEQQQQQPAEEQEAELPRDQAVEVPSGADGAFKLLNVETSEWRVVDVSGDGVFSAVRGSLVRLRVGGRYHIDLRGVDSEVLPLDVRSIRGRVLFSQREGAGSMEMEGVNPEISGEGITFTLTEELAQQIATYRAAPYPGMVGFVSAVPQEPADGDDGDQGGDEEPEQTNQG